MLLRSNYVCYHGWQSTCQYR